MKRVLHAPSLLRTLTLCGAAAFVCAASEAGARMIPPPIAVVDLHVDLSYRVSYGNGTLAKGSGQEVAASARRGGVGGLVLPLFVPFRVSPTGPRTEDLEASYAKMMALIPQTPPYLAPGCAVSSGGVRTWFAFEGSAPLANDESAVAKWTARGVRLFGLVHTTDNVLATSSSPSQRSKDPTAAGLTELGRAFVHRVHAAGAYVDVSHASDAATADVIALATQDHVPVVATHSNARALAPHPRNLTDDQLRAIAATGGIIGVNFHSSFLVSRGRATIDDVVRHVRHMIDVAGVDHVAIGSDFEGDITAPVGLESSAKFPALARALALAGVPREQVEKVFSGNALRLLCPTDAPRVSPAPRE